MLKREWGAESNEKLLHLFIPSETETLVPDFAVEDLHLDRTATLVPAFAVKTCPWTEHSDNDDELHKNLNINVIFILVKL